MCSSHLRYDRGSRSQDLAHIQDRRYGSVPASGCYDACMRTTVTLDDEIHEEARRMAFETRRTFSEVVNELLTEGLKSITRPAERRRLGQLRGTISIADDFDETPAEVLDAINLPLHPSAATSDNTSHPAEVINSIDRPF